MKATSTQELLIDALQSRDKNDTLNMEGWTPAYVPPEFFLGATPNTSADIWAVGCLLLELWSAKLNWEFWFLRGTADVLSSPSDVTDERIMSLWQAASKDQKRVFATLAAGGSPPLPDNMLPTTAKYFSLCFIGNPDKRPTVERLLRDEFLAVHAERENVLSEWHDSSSRCAPEQYGFTEHPWDRSLLCDGHRVSQTYDKLKEGNFVHWRHPCILYSHNKIRDNHTKWVSAMQQDNHTTNAVLNCSFSLSHNCCPEVVKSIHEISQHEHTGTLIMQLLAPHHFDIVEAVIPKVHWSQCVIDGTRFLPQEYLLKAIMAEMCFRVYSFLDIENLYLAQTSVASIEALRRVKVMLCTEEAAAIEKQLLQPCNTKYKEMVKLHGYCIDVREFIQRSNDLDGELIAEHIASCVPASTMRSLHVHVSGLCTGSESEESWEVEERMRQVLSLFVQRADHFMCLFDISHWIMKHSVAMIVPVRSSRVIGPPSGDGRYTTLTPGVDPYGVKIMVEFAPDAGHQGSVKPIHGLVERNMTCRSQLVSSYNKEWDMLLEALHTVLGLVHPSVIRDSFALEFPGVSLESHCMHTVLVRFSSRIQQLSVRFAGWLSKYTS